MTAEGGKTSEVTNTVYGEFHKCGHMKVPPTSCWVKDGWLESTHLFLFQIKLSCMQKIRWGLDGGGCRWGDITEA